MGIVSIASATLLSFNLFVAQTTKAEFLYLNNGIVNCLIILLLIIITLIPIKLQQISNAKYIDIVPKLRFGNRAFTYFFHNMLKKERALDIRIYGQEKVSSHYWEEYGIAKKGTPLVDYFMKTSSMLSALSWAIRVCLTGIIYMFVGLKSLGGAFGVGQVTQYIGATSKFVSAITTMLNSINDMTVNASFLRTEFELLDTENVMYRGSLTTEKRRDKKYQVEFKNVSFKYPESDEFVLKNVSIKFEIGKKLAIVGENGSGKTTFIKLLCRLYEPTDGEILLNGIIFCFSFL